MAYTSVFMEVDEELAHVITCKTEENAARVAAALNEAYPNGLADVSESAIDLKLKTYDPAFYAEVMGKINQART